jgi:hypothetical protein
MKPRRKTKQGTEKKKIQGGVFLKLSPIFSFLMETKRMKTIMIRVKARMKEVERQ